MPLIAAEKQTSRDYRLAYESTWACSRHKRERHFYYTVEQIDGRSQDTGICRLVCE
jgi:hypothetical protein